MKIRTLLASLVCASSLAFANIASAQFDPVGDDTDIFLANPLIAATRPNILFFVDNTANWNTAFSIEKQALINTTNNLVTDAFNVGMGMFVETGSPNDNINGSYIRYGIRQMTPTNKSRFVSMINALDISGDKSNNAAYSLAMDEMFRYFAGKDSYSGFGKAKRDYPGNATYNSYASDLPGAPFSSSTSRRYISPIVSGCQKNFIIFISNGAADNSDSDTSSPAQGFLTTWQSPDPLSTLPLSPSGEQGIWADEYAKFMAEKDCSSTVDGIQNVFTYTIDVLPQTGGQGPDHTALLKSMADRGKGRYFAVNSVADTSELENILRTIFQEVQAVNSVFASVALPVSVNVRGTNLNQVYIGQFRPDQAKGPRWFGNLKMYKIGQDTSTGEAFLVDTDGNRAENSATGFISPNAKSFWTADSTFWNHRNADENGAGGASDLPDGDLVEKGGAAQRLRTRYPSDQAQRQVYTCVSATGFCNSGDLLSSSPFAVSNADVTGADLGTYTKKPVASITAALSGGNPTATATVAAHGFADGDEVKITGASPSAYNQTARITLVDANTFTYDLPSLPPANVARVSTASAHNLVSGDLIDVTGATPAGYNVSDSSVTRIDGTTFEYAMSASATTASSGHTIVGKKRVTSLSGVGTSATATAAGHGYAVGDTVTISGANEAAFNATNVTVTRSDANSFDYTTSIPITGTANTARVSTAPNRHGFSTGNTVTITGSAQSVYNGSFPIIKIDDTHFSYTISGVASMESPSPAVASIGISQISHPTNGNSQNVAVVTTSVSFCDPQPSQCENQSVIISNTGGVPPSGYDGTWTITSVTSSGFKINASGANNSIRQSPTPKTTAGMLAGKIVASIEPVVQATGTILSAKPISSVNSVSSKANATGVMYAGRPSDVDATDRDNLILWVRGRDNAENEKSNVTAPDVRPSIHGDVLHSRPAVVNYGRAANEDDVYIFYGTNDGGLRAVKGGLATVAGDTHPNGDPVQPGDERWTFIPKEVFGKFERLRSRTPAISRDNPRDYFVDGDVSAYTKDVNNDGKLVAADGDKVYLYFVMRRGGDSIYALDVSDPGTPKFMWRKQAGDLGYEELGQTWSAATVARIQANTRPSETTSSNPDNVVLVLGGGYDPDPEDVAPCLKQSGDGTSVVEVPVGDGVITFNSSGSCSVSGSTGGATTLFRTRGRALLVVDALDGHVIWQAGPAPINATHNVTVPDMAYAVPGDVRVIDFTGDGFADSAYFGDTGGQVWRLDLAATDASTWVLRKIASLASGVSTDVPNHRKFLFQPEVTVAEDNLGLYRAVLIGSGDREHPFDGVTVDRFYMLKDRGEADTLGSFAGTRSWSESSSALSGGTGGTALAGGVIREADLFDATTTPGASDSGWMHTMRPGEKTVSAALVVAGEAVFSTNQPTVLAGAAVDACASNLGVARIYTIAVADGTGESVIRAGGGYVPSPVFAAIQLGSTSSSTTTIPSSSTGTCTGAACGDSTTAGGGGGGGGPVSGIVCTGTSCWSVGTIDVGSRRRSYWYKAID